jgi:hypothetical protein
MALIWLPVLYMPPSLIKAPKGSGIGRKGSQNKRLGIYRDWHGKQYLIGKRIIKFG